jgi:hypothetical protein
MILPVMVVHIYNLSIQEVKAQESRVWGQSGQHSKTVSKNQNNINNWLIN